MPAGTLELGWTYSCPKLNQINQTFIFHQSLDTGHKRKGMTLGKMAVSN